MPEELTCREKIMSNEYKDFLVSIGEYTLLGLSEEVRSCIQQIIGEYRVLYVRGVSDGLPMSALGYQTVPKLYTITDSTNMDASGITRLRNQPYLNLTGNGVLIGLIDTGIDYTHPAFRYSDGSSRIVGIWDQTVQSGETPPGILYGSEYRKAQIDEALKLDDPYELVPSRDENGHGTFLAGIAAGGEDISNDFIGAAPQASIAMVKLKQAKPYLREYYRVREGAYAVQENDIMTGVRYLIETSRRLNMPVVILIGLGTNMGGHENGTYLSNLLSDISSYIGLCTVVAGGNEGNENTHYRGSLSISDVSEPAEFVVAENSIGFSIELWTRIPAAVSVEIISPTGEKTPNMGLRPGRHEDYRFVFENTVISVDYLVPLGIQGENLLFIRFIDPSPGLWRMQISGSYISPDDYFDIWLPVRDFMGEGTYFLRPDPYITLTDPSNTPKVITVTAYNHRDNSIYLKAGRGFNRRDMIKPDLAAPGVNIFGPAAGGGYTSQTGSSIAAAHVAGASAMLLEWGILRANLYSMDTGIIKGYLIRGADRNAGVTYPNREWGADGNIVSGYWKYWFCFENNKNHVQNV